MILVITCTMVTRVLLIIDIVLAAVTKALVIVVINMLQCLYVLVECCLVNSQLLTTDEFFNKNGNLTIIARGNRIVIMNNSQFQHKTI